MHKFNITYSRLFRLFLLILCLQLPGLANADLQVQQLWFADVNAELSEEAALIRFNQQKAATLTEPVFQLGNTPQKAWVLIAVTNPGAQAVSARLLTGAPYSRLLQARLLSPDTDEIISIEGSHILIDEHENRIFSERENNLRLLNSNAFTIAGQTTVKVLIQTIVEGPSYLPFSVLTEREFAAFELQDGVFAALFYGFSLTLGLLFLLFSLAVRHRVAIMYAGLFLLGLLVVADIDGFAFRWLWPDYPRWNHVSPLVVLPLLNGLGFLIIHQLLVSVENQRLALLKPGALGLVAVSVLLPLGLMVLPFATVLQMENLLSVPAFLLQPVAFTAWLHLGRRNLLSTLALGVVGLVIAVLVASVFMDLQLPVIVLEHLHHAAYVIVGVMVMGMITVQLMGLHKDQQATLKRELTLAQENAQMSDALLAAEKNYSRARQLANKHQQQLASASHDLRQPIVSLRSGIDAIAVTQAPAIRQQLQDAFNYLEQLCNQYLQQTRPEMSDTPDPGTREQPVADAYPASLIIGTVERMFTEEAISRGVALHTVESSAVLHTDPLVVMRIVSNLVANAIKHHSGGERARVLLGCRRKPDGLHIMVCDNGRGMSTEELEQLQQAYHKGDDSEGEGLGLAIIYQLAQANNIRLSVRSEVGQGTCFTVQLPRNVG